MSVKAEGRGSKDAGQRTAKFKAIPAAIRRQFRQWVNQGFGFRALKDQGRTAIGERQANSPTPGHGAIHFHHW